MRLHEAVYAAMRSSLTKGDGAASIPNWDELPEFVRSYGLAVAIEAASVEREACATVADNRAAFVCDNDGLYFNTIEIADLIRSRR